MSAAETAVIISGHPVVPCKKGHYVHYVLDDRDIRERCGTLIGENVIYYSNEGDSDWDN